jgi:hypothetical protein
MRSDMEAAGLPAEGAGSPNSDYVGSPGRQEMNRLLAIVQRDERERGKRQG